LEHERRFNQTNRIDGDSEAVPAARPIPVPTIRKALGIKMDDGIMSLDPSDPHLPIEQSGKIEIGLQAPGTPGRRCGRAFHPGDLDVLQDQRRMRQPGDSDCALDQHRPPQGAARNLGEQILVGIQIDR
jgi:hypothetical protein